MKVIQLRLFYHVNIYQIIICKCNIMRTNVLIFFGDENNKSTSNCKSYSISDLASQNSFLRCSSWISCLESRFQLLLKITQPPKL